MVPVLRFITRCFAWLFRGRHRAWRPGEVIECLVVGYGGANNTGAEARTAEAIRQMLDADPRLRVTLTSLDRRQTLRYVEEGERLRVAQIHPVFVGSLLRLVRRTDCVVIIEGSCFKENFSAALLWFFLYALDLAQRFGLPTVTYGVDAGPLSPVNRAWAREVAERVDLLMVRTEAAAEALRAIGVARPLVVTTDTAFTLVPERASWVETVLGGQGVDLARPIVGIAFEEFFWWPVVPKPLRAFFGISKGRYKSIYYYSWDDERQRRSCEMQEAMAAYADGIIERFGAQLLFFAMERLDIEPCRSVQERMRHSSLLIDADHANARQIAAVLQRLDWLVTCRYHALIFAMGGGVPTIGLGHDERIAAIMDELGLLQDYFISYEEPRLQGMLEAKTDELRRDAAEIRKRIVAALPSYRERMAENATHFRTLLERRFPV